MNPSPKFFSKTYTVNQIFNRVLQPQFVLPFMFLTPTEIFWMYVPAFELENTQVEFEKNNE